jgi:hypothetical protein
MVPSKRTIIPAPQGRIDMTGTICGNAALDTPPGRNHDATTVLVGDALPVLRADMDELAQVAAQHRPAIIVDANRSPEADTIVAAANRFGRGL